MKFRFLLPLAVALLSALAQAQQRVPLNARADFTSHPSHATVMIDGVERGVTPLSLYDVAPGSHRVKFRLNGYEDHDLIAEAAYGRVMQHSVILEPLKGILLLQSDPEGADIVIDGASIGTTPRLITHLDAKDRHRITLNLAGYCQRVLDVHFEGRKPQVRMEKMMLDSGIVKVESDPAGAEVFVNGVSRGVTPIEVRDVPKGRATIRVSLAGYEPEQRELSIKAGDEQTLALALKGKPGKLTLSSVPEGARLYIDGEFKGMSFVSEKVKAGEHVVRAELKGYGTKEETVTVNNDETVNREFRLENQMGRLEVRSSPAGAQVVFDGKVMGVTKSKDPDAEFSDVFAINDVLEGEHVLVLKCDGYADATRHPKIQNSKTSQAKVHLKRIFKPDVRIELESGSVDGVFVKRDDEYVVIEEKPGIQRSFRRSEVKKITFLNK